MKRVQSEIEEKGQNNIDTAKRIIGGAKGPFGIVTLLAVLIVGGIAVLNMNTSQKQTVTTPENISISPSETQRQTVKVIEFEGRKVPLSELEVRSGPDCDATHYHAKNGVHVTALDGTVISDPGSCAYGKVANVTVLEVER